MPLYNNILVSKKGNDSKNGQAPTTASKPSASMKFLQDHLQSKKRSKTQSLPTKVPKQTDRSQIISENTLHRPSENNWDPSEEYDPLVPNSFEVLHAEYVKNEELRSLARMGTGKIDSNLLEALDKLEDDTFAVDGKINRGSAIAPPPSLLESIGKESQSPTQDNGPKKPSQTTGKIDGQRAAANIMSKMGYKVGQGLGKDEQGISSPLEVEKSGINSGRIVQQSTPTKSYDMANLLRDSTRVVLLQNMVGPGEVDEELEAETKEECSKYGEVVKCLIYEIPNKRVPDDEAVRIFVEFRKVESAIKATSDLNGRYFGGRVVKASFYELDRFNRYELGP